MCLHEHAQHAQSRLCHCSVRASVLSLFLYALVRFLVLLMHPLMQTLMQSFPSFSFHVQLLPLVPPGSNAGGACHLDVYAL